MDKMYFDLFHNLAAGGLSCTVDETLCNLGCSPWAKDCQLKNSNRTYGVMSRLEVAPSIKQREFFDNTTQPTSSNIHMYHDERWTRQYKTAPAYAERTSVSRSTFGQQAHCLCRKTSLSRKATEIAAAHTYFPLAFQPGSALSNVPAISLPWSPSPTTTSLLIVLKLHTLGAP